MAKLSKIRRNRGHIAFVGFLLLFSSILISFSIEFDWTYRKDNDIIGYDGDNDALPDFHNKFNNIGPQDDDDEEKKEDEEDTGDMDDDFYEMAQNYLRDYFYYLLLGGSAIIVAAYSVHQYKKWKAAKLVKKERELESDILINPVKSTNTIIQDFKSQSTQSKIFQEENALEKLMDLGDLDLTTVSEEFFEIIDTFGWDQDEKIIFIKEMLALAPSERQRILNNMVKKSRPFVK